jgi:hypothetical protein
MEENPKIRRKPLAFARLIFKDYADCLFDREKAANAFLDLLHAWLYNREASQPRNQTMIDEGYEYIAEKKRKVAEWNKKKAEKKKADGQPQEEGGLFSQEKENEQPTSKAAAAYAKSIGIPGEIAEEWYEWSKGNGWRDEQGGPIRSWKRTLVAFAKKKQPDFKPITTTAAQPQEEK